MAFKYHWLVLALCIMRSTLGRAHNCPVQCPRAAATWGYTDGLLKYVSVGLAGVWGVDANNKIYFRSDSYGDEDGCPPWQQISGALKQLDVGNNVVWGVSPSNTIYYRQGISASNPTGDLLWVEVSGSLKHVSVSPKGHVWGVNMADDIFHRIGASNCNRAGNSWRHIDGNLKQISVGSGGVWGVSSGNNVYYREGTFGDPTSDPDGSGWKHVSGGLYIMYIKYISSADMIYGVSTANAIYYRLGVTTALPSGTKWKQTYGGLKQVESLSCVVWGVNVKDQIYKKKTD